MSDTDNKTVKVPCSTRNYLKPDEVNERGDGDENPKPQDSRMYFCRYCGKGFKSCNALCGHMRIHGQDRRNSKTRVHNIELAEKEHSSEEEEEDEGFGCFACKESFSTMKLLVQHMTMHRGTGADDDDSIREAESWRVYYGPETQIKTTRNKSNPRTSMKKRTRVERVHQCEICDKIFATGQALGGHKTKHRVKGALKLDSIRQESRCDVTNITRNLFPGEEADHDRLKTKRVLDFDLNIPYQE